MLRTYYKEKGREKGRKNSGRFSGNSKFFFTEIEIIWQAAVKYFWVPEESKEGKKQASKGKMLMNHRGEKKIKFKRKQKKEISNSILNIHPHPAGLGGACSVSLGHQAGAQAAVLGNG